MKYNPQIHHRRSIRLKEYDYGQPGQYFITICTHNKQCWFGEIRNFQMQLNHLGSIVAQEWLRTPKIRPEIVLDEWIVIPHFSLIVRSPTPEALPNLDLIWAIALPAKTTVCCSASTQNYHRLDVERNEKLKAIFFEYN